MKHFIFLLLLCFSSFATTYHVAKTGNDTTGDGLSFETAWATIGKAENNVSPDDTVIVYEGDYYETTNWLNGGSDGSPVTVIANTGDTVRLMGSTQLSTWTQCQSDDPHLTVQTVINPNYANIYYAEFASLTSTKPVLLYEDGSLLKLASEPDRSVAVPTFSDEFAAGTGFGSGYIDDTVNRDEADDYWNDGDAIIIFYDSSGNSVSSSIYIVTDFANTNSRISFSGFTSATGDKYCLLNHPHSIKAAGEYCYTLDLVSGNYRIYCWPLDTDNLSSGNMSYTNTGTASQTIDAGYITFDGLDICCGGQGSAGMIRCVEEVGIIIQNCNIHDAATPLCGFFGVTSPQFLNCTLSNAWLAGSRGITCGKNGASSWTTGGTIISNCTFTAIDSSAIFLDRNGGEIVISDCTMTNLGEHAGCASVYGHKDGQEDIIIRRNVMINDHACLQMHGYAGVYSDEDEVRDIYILSNVMMNENSAKVTIWSDWTIIGYTYCYGNTLVSGESYTEYSWIYHPEYFGVLSVYNNALGYIKTSDMANIDNHDYNAYYFMQDEEDASAHDVISTWSSLFTDPDNNDFTVKSGSDLINNANATYMQSTDVEGTSYITNDIGAYAYPSEASSTSTQHQKIDMSIGIGL
jgi:hypothetical protein